MQTGQLILTLEGHSNAVSNLVVMPTGELISESWDLTVRVWNPSTGKLIRSLPGNHDVWGLIALHTGQLAIAESEEKIFIWNIATGQVVRELKFAGQSDMPFSIVGLPNGELVSYSHDKLFRVWNTTSGELKKTKEKSGRPTYTSFAVLPSGELASGGDYEIRIYNTEAWRSRLILESDAGKIETLVALPDGTIISGHADGSITKWF